MPNNAPFNTPGDALECLAESLFFKLEHLDPSEDRVGDIEWSELEEDQKDIYRLAVMWVIRQKEAVKIALDEK